MEHKLTKEVQKIFTILLVLKEQYPNEGLLKFIVEATTDYKNLWLLSDKELLFVLEKYQAELEMNLASPEEVDRIIKDAEQLTSGVEGMFDVDSEENWIH